MKSIIVRGASLSAALFLSACNTTGTSTVDVASIIASAQAAAKALCAIVPTATAIANIVAAENGAVVTGEAVAQAICSAVSTKKSVSREASGSGSVTVTVNGKTIVVPYDRVQQ